MEDQERERLVCFLYLLTRGTPKAAGIGWGSVNYIAREIGDTSQLVYTSKAGEALARELAARILKGN